MQRRGFLAGILAAGFAPAAIGSGVLMPVRTFDRGIILWGDGYRDDTAALQALIHGRRVLRPDGSVIAALVGGSYLITETLVIPAGKSFSARNSSFQSRGLVGPMVQVESGGGLDLCQNCLTASPA